MKECMLASAQFALVDFQNRTNPTWKKMEDALKSKQYAFNNKSITLLDVILRDLREAKNHPESLQKVVHFLFLSSIVD